MAYLRHITKRRILKGIKRLAGIARVVKYCNKTNKKVAQGAMVCMVKYYKHILVQIREKEQELIRAAANRKEVKENIG